jgi:hypothetical protein
LLSVRQAGCPDECQAAANRILSREMTNSSHLTVFRTRGDATCGGCDEPLGRHAWITLDRERGALCLACADLDHLVFLPAGDAALTRRARKHSALTAVVLQWSRARERYERQGLLVEEAALARAEEECLADAEARERRRVREAERRAEEDQEYVAAFAAAVRELYPAAPQGRDQVIAKHACRKYSGRVGRSASAKRLDAEAVRLAVIAHVRHAETPYDELLSQGFERSPARAAVEDQVARVLARWAGSET